MRERLRQIVLPVVPPILVGILLALLGPFGTFGAYSVEARMAFWLTAVLVNWLVMELTVTYVARRFAERLPWPLATVPLLSSLAAWIPCTLVVLGAYRVILGDDMAEDLPGLAWKVLVLLIAVSAAAYAFNRLRRAAQDGGPEAEVQPSPDDPTSTFRARWPEKLTGRLLALEMEDHYLRVHTSEGNDVILCRMEDAARDLAAADGLRVHRSYWVARAAVREVRRRGKQPVLVLDNGLEVPVGRTYAPKVREAGWI